MRVNIDDTDTDVDGTKLYEGAPYTGEVIETDGNGNVIYLNTYTTGYDDGPFREWFSDGGLKSEGQALRGAPVGVWRTWHANGQLAAEDAFGDDGRLRARKRWAEDGMQTEDYTATTTS